MCSQASCKLRNRKTGFLRTPRESTLLFQKHNLPISQKFPDLLRKLLLLKEGHEAVPFKITHTCSRHVCMHTNIQVASQPHSLRQTSIRTASLAQSFVLGENLGGIQYSFPHKFLYLLAGIYFPGKKSSLSMSMTNQIFFLWELRRSFFMDMPQFFQICQFSSFRIHEQTQSSSFKSTWMCLSSLLVNLWQLYDKKSSALPLGI